MIRGRGSRSRLALPGFLCPSVLERDRAVENGRAGLRIGIEREVAETLELVALIGFRGGEARLELRGDRFERARIDVLFEVARRVRLRDREEPVVEPHFGVDGVRG